MVSLISNDRARHFQETVFLSNICLPSRKSLQWNTSYFRVNCLFPQSQWELEENVKAYCCWTPGGEGTGPWWDERRPWTRAGVRAGGVRAPHQAPQPTPGLQVSRPWALRGCNGVGEDLLGSQEHPRPTDPPCLASWNKLLQTRRTSKARWATLNESTGRKPEAQFAVEIGLDLIWVFSALTRWKLAQIPKSKIKWHLIVTRL